jgi:DNA replication protein DnaC
MAKKLRNRDGIADRLRAHCHGITEHPDFSFIAHTHKLRNEQYIDRRLDMEMIETKDSAAENGGQRACDEKSVVETQLLAEFLKSQFHELVIEGEAGIGKSELLRNFAYQLANKLLAPLPKKNASGRVNSPMPLFLTLPDLKAELKGTWSNHQITDKIIALGTNHNNALTTSDIQELARQNNLVLIVDGIDEVLHDESRRDLVNAISFVIKSQSNSTLANARVIFGGRPWALYAIDHHFHVMRLTSFSEADCQQFIKRYFQNEPCVAGNLITGLLSSNNVFRQAVRNPLLLRLACQQARKVGTLPTDIAHLMAGWRDALLKSRQLLTHPNRQTLEHFAFMMLDSGQPIDRHKTIAVLQIDARDRTRIRKVIEKSGIAARQGDELSLHRDLQPLIEYLAGCHLAAMKKEERINICDRLVWTDRMRPTLRWMAYSLREVNGGPDGDLADLVERWLSVVERRGDDIFHRLLQQVVDFLPLLSADAVRHHSGDENCSIMARFRRCTAFEQGKLRPGLAPYIALEGLASLPLFIRRPWIDHLIATLNNRTGAKFYRAAEELGELGDNDAAAIQSLICALQDDSFPRKDLAARSLGNIAFGNQEAIKALIEVIDNRQFPSRLLIPFPLGRIAPGNPIAIAALKRAVKDAKFPDRPSAALALRQIAGGDMDAETLAANMLGSNISQLKFRLSKSDNRLEGDMVPIDKLVETALAGTFDRKAERAIVALKHFLTKADGGKPTVLIPIYSHTEAKRYIPIKWSPKYFAIDTSTTTGGAAGPTLSPVGYFLIPVNKWGQFVTAVLSGPAMSGLVAPNVSPLITGNPSSPNTANQIAAVDLVLNEAECSVSVDNVNFGRLTPKAFVLLRRMMSQPRHVWKFHELLDPQQNYDPKDPTQKKAYQDRVRDVAKTLPKEVQALFEPLGGGHHGGRIFRPHVRPRILSQSLQSEPR